MKKNLKVCKNFTYYTIVKEAILAEKEQRATSSQIFAYITDKHPHLFKESNSMTWKGNIRQILSKHPEFVKLPKEEVSKLHYWKFVPLDEIVEKELQTLHKTQSYNANFLTLPYFYNQGYRINNPPSYYNHQNNLYGNTNDDFGNFINNQYIGQYENQRYEPQVRYEPHQQNIYKQRNIHNQQKIHSQQSSYNDSQNEWNHSKSSLELSVELEKRYKKKKLSINKACITKKRDAMKKTRKQDKPKKSHKFSCSEVFGDVRSRDLHFSDTNKENIYNLNMNNNSQSDINNNLNMNNNSQSDIINNLNTNNNNQSDINNNLNTNNNSQSDINNNLNMNKVDIFNNAELKAFNYDSTIKNKTNSEINFNTSKGLIRPENASIGNQKEKLFISGSQYDFFIENEDSTSKVSFKENRDLRDKN